MGRTYKVDFDGKRVATDVSPGWSDDTVRHLPIGPNTMGYFGAVRIFTAPGSDHYPEHDERSGGDVDVFEWVDNTDTTPGAPQTANVVSRRLLDEPGYVSCGHFGVYPSEASVS